MDYESGEYEALSETGSSYFLDRLEQARALMRVLREANPEPDRVEV
jgi:hypothetical protein